MNIQGDVCMKVVQKKICLLGEFAVGKTSLVRRYVEGRFSEEYLSTIGAQVSRKVLMRGDHELHLMVWDLVGGSEFSRREAGYLLGTSGALIVCDLTRPETLEAVISYANRLRAVNPKAAIVFVGNKVDLKAERAIDDESLFAVCHPFSKQVVLTSAKTGEMVEEAFALLADMLEEIV
jgi:small GTP-binding protein